MQIYPQKRRRNVVKKTKTDFCFMLFFYYLNSIFFLSRIFYLSFLFKFYPFLYIGNSILLILDFVDNILNRHNCSCSCKSNSTFFCYFIIRKKMT